MQSNLKFKDVIAFYYNYLDEDDKIFKYLDYKVIEEVTDFKRATPFKHKHIYVWWILEKNICIGLNENPAIGISFVIKRNKLGLINK